MTTEDNFSAARIADRMKIQDLMYRWCRAIDRLDYDSIRDIFHPDATDSHGAYVGGVDGLVDWIRQRHQVISFSVHQVSNILIEFAGPNLALVETYIWAVQRYTPEGKASLAQLSGGATGQEGSGTDMLTASRYIDRIERRDDQWRIVRRTLSSGWRSMLDVAADGPKMMPGWIVGRRDSEDFLYQERRTLGIGQSAS